MTTEVIRVPDIGGAEGVEVIEVCVAVGDRIEAEASLVVLESDKASMEVPAPKGGTITAIHLKEGDKVSEGAEILTLELSADDAGDSAGEASSKAAAGASASTAKQGENKPTDAPSAPQEKRPQAAKQGAAGRELIRVPELGGTEQVDVIEVCVAEGDTVAEGDSLIVLESDKASMEVPSPRAGKVLALKIAEGDKVGEGAAILELEVAAAAEEDEAPAASGDAAPAQADESQGSSQGSSQGQAQTRTAPARPDVARSTAGAEPASAGGEALVYAGPAVRKLARELGIGLERVPGTGPKGRILKEDIQRFVQALVEQRGSGSGAGVAVPALPEIDFAQFGEIETRPLSKLHKLTAANMQRSWLNVPHVTQFDDADITDLEDFRNSLKAEAERRGVRLTPVPFLLKAVARALQLHPDVNVSLLNDGEHVVYKKYVHVGMAVDTPAGLVVPVLRDVDRKSVWELAAEVAELAEKARERKLRPADMQGGCFSISSLGAIGGRGFTPIVNTPEVAILGISRMDVQPVWDGKQFAPRKMLPLSLSYDHRAINGAVAGRFMTDLVGLLADIRRLVL